MNKRLMNKALIAATLLSFNTFGNTTPVGERSVRKITVDFSTLKYNPKTIDLQSFEDEFRNNNLFKKEIFKKDTKKIFEDAKLVEYREFFGAGSTGGGQGKDGKIRDLFSEPDLSCDSTMSEYVENFPTFKKTFSLIQGVNLGFAIEMKKEMDKIVICEANGELNSDLIENQDGLIVAETDFDQYAIRAIFPYKGSYGVHVYLAKDHFHSMESEKQQSFLLMHELLHSFVEPEPVVSYISRLKSVVGKLSQAENKGELSLGELNRISKFYNFSNYATPKEMALKYVIEYGGELNEVSPLLESILAQEIPTQDDLQVMAYKILSKSYFEEDDNQALEVLKNFGLDFNREAEIIRKKCKLPMVRRECRQRKNTLFTYFEIINDLDALEYILNATPEYRASHQAAKDYFDGLLWAGFMSQSYVSLEGEPELSTMWLSLSNKERNKLKKRLKANNDHYVSKTIVEALGSHY